MRAIAALRNVEGEVLDLPADGRVDWLAGSALRSPMELMKSIVETEARRPSEVVPPGLVAASFVAISTRSSARRSRKIRPPATTMPR
jgi:hypothetical protein